MDIRSVDVIYVCTLVREHNNYIQGFSKQFITVLRGDDAKDMKLFPVVNF